MAIIVEVCSKKHLSFYTTPSRKIKYLSTQQQILTSFLAYFHHIADQRPCLPLPITTNLLFLIPLNKDVLDFDFYLLHRQGLRHDKAFEVQFSSVYGVDLTSLYPHLAWHLQIVGKAKYRWGGGLCPQRPEVVES